MKKTWSLRRQLSMRLAGLFAVLWIVTSGITIYIFYEEISEVFDSSLEETAHRIIPLICALETAPGGIAQIEADDLITEDYEHDEYVTYQVRNRNAGVVLRSSDAPASGWPIPASNGFINDGPWRI